MAEGEGPSKVQRLLDSGVIPDVSKLDVGDREKIEEVLTDADVDALIRIKGKVGPHFQGKDYGCGPGHLIFF